MLEIWRIHLFLEICFYFFKLDLPDAKFTLLKYALQAQHMMVPMQGTE